MHQRALLPFFVAGLLLGRQGAAQTASPAEDRPFFLKQEITVTATRSEVEPSQSPVSAAVVSSEEIATRNIQAVDQALYTTPGVYLSRGKGYQDTLTGVGMRGFSARGSNQNRTLVLLDGQPLNNPYTGSVAWTVLPVEEVDRVEVVRGPFSSLYGSNAMGGVIQILTKPVDRRRAEFKGEYGSQDTFRYSGRVSDRLFDRLGLSLGYERLQSGGYPSQLVTTAGSVGTGGTPVTGFIPSLTSSGAATFVIGRSGDNWWNQDNWRARGDYSFSSRTMLAVQYMRQASNYGYDAYTTFLRTADGQPFDSGTASITAGGQTRRLSVSPSLFLPGDGGDRSHMASARLYHSFRAPMRLRLGAGQIYAPVSYYSTPGTGSSLAGGPGTISERPGRAWFGDIQWSWNGGSHHTLTAGTDLRRDSSQVAELAVPNYTRRTENAFPTYFSQGKAYTQGGYAQHEWRASERLLVVSGARYDYWRTYDGGNETPGTTLKNAYAERSHQSFSGKAAVLYRAPKGFALRASAGNAYRNPSVYDLYRTWRSSAGTIFASNPNLLPERVVSWEAGVNRRWNGGLEADAVFYQNHISDLIYRTTDLNVDPSGRYRPVVNAARALARGVEASVRAPVRSWLFLRTSYTWSSAKITENPAAPASVDKRVPQVPAHVAAAGIFVVRKRWSAALTGRYVSAVFNTDTNTDTTRGVYGAFDPYFEADASVTVDLTRRLSLQLSADNLLDRIYYSYYPVPGRLVFAGLRFRL